MGESPFARFHLFRNPFGELTVEERAELAVIDLQRCLDWLARSDKSALQIIGPCGHGKSTHLRAIQAALEWQGAINYVYFDQFGNQPAFPKARPLLVDEAQRMSWWRRRQLLNGKGPIALATHDDLTAHLQRAGFDVLTIDLDQPLDTVRLQEILNRRILASRTTEQSVTQVATQATTQAATQAITRSAALRYHPLCLSQEQVVALQRRFGSNIRQMEAYLYERFKLFAEKGEPWLPVN